MRKLTKAAVITGGTALTGAVAAGASRRRHLASLDAELIKRLNGLDTETLGNSTALNEIATKYDLTELTSGADFRRTGTIAERQALVAAFIELRFKETDGAITSGLTQFEQDYLVLGLTGAVREAQNRRRRGGAIHTETAPTTTD